MMTKFTPGPWRVEHMGGASTVLAPSRPRYNNTATPPYGYRDSGPFCVATIFQEDGGHIRRDFVTFSHEDARLIAAAPELYEIAKMFSEYELLMDEGDDIGGMLKYNEVSSSVAKVLERLNTL